jgi:hypothetical protein
MARTLIYRDWETGLFVFQVNMDAEPRSREVCVTNAGAWLCPSPHSPKPEELEEPRRSSIANAHLL